MKNAINYYYNIVTNDIHHKDDQYYFKKDNQLYLLFPFIGDINYQKQIYEYLKNINIYCHQIVNNKDNQAITIINNLPYILLKTNIINRKINLSDITNYTVPIEINNKNNWHTKWCEKLDYYEYQIEQFKTKYQELYFSFWYYSGLTETAISLLNYVDLKKVNTYISHNRIGKNTSLVDLYNPLNFIVDTRVRNISEYFKNLFFNQHNPIEEVNSYLSTNNLSYDEAILFLSRMIYPSYYFDIYDDIINGKNDDNKITSITNKADEYELFLKNIYHATQQIYNIPEIEWLKKT